MPRLAAKYIVTLGNMEKAYQFTEFSDLSKDYSVYDRFYVGDQHCEHDCLAILTNQALFDFVRKSGKPITVLTPQVSELHYDRFVSLI